MATQGGDGGTRRPATVILVIAGDTDEVKPSPSLPRSGWAGRDGDATSGSWPWPVLQDLTVATWSVVVAGLGVSAGLAVVGGVHVRSTPVLLTALASGVVVLEAVISPVLRRLASLGSVALALVLGVVAQVALLAVVLFWAVGDPGLGWQGTGTVLLVAAGFLALGRWLVGATDSGYVVGAATGRTGRLMTAQRRSALRAAGEDTRGLLVVQLDGVSAPVLRQAIEAGQAPNLARWIGTSHTLTQWWATIPSTTPASMAGILHCDDEQVPAFRWWDRPSGRLLAASRPADSRLVEGRFPPGQGLLRGGGTAISTTYGGEAEHAYLTISRAAGSRGLGSGATYFSFFARPFLLPGALVLTLGEMVKEVYQAHRQKVRGVEPRISRAGSYVVVRGITNVLMRKLNLSLVAQEMAAGRPIVFVDFVDYDEIAHHAGPERPEALRALEGLDAVLGALRDVARGCVREYELVVLSDHGQSLGATFEQVSGHMLGDRVAGLMHGAGAGDEDEDDDGLTERERASRPVVPEDEGSQRPGPGEGPREGAGEVAGGDGDVTRVERSAGEEWGPVNALVASVLARWGRVDRVVLGPDRRAGSHPGARDDSRARGVETTRSLPELALTAGGNLAMVWFPRMPDRPGLGEIVRSWPRLVPGLVATPGVGLVMVTSSDGSPLALGRSGARSLTTGEVDGDDPLVGYPLRTAADLARLHGLRHCGDVVVISEVDDRGRVLAFEHQVGSHGGVGGQQNQALLVHPREWSVDPELAEATEDVDGRRGGRLLVGPVAVHHQLMAWRRGIGAGPDDGDP